MLANFLLYSLALRHLAPLMQDFSAYLPSILPVLSPNVYSHLAPVVVQLPEGIKQAFSCVIDTTGYQLAEVGLHA